MGIRTRALLARIRHRYRSSITGRWVSKRTADDQPDTTIREAWRRRREPPSP